MKEVKPNIVKYVGKRILDNFRCKFKEGAKSLDIRPLPLSGIRVMEAGHTIMGPTAGLILADMGAEVIKIERPPKGDDTRYLKGFGS